MPPDVCVLVSTYNMLGFQGHRSNVAAKVYEKGQGAMGRSLLRPDVIFVSEIFLEGRGSDTPPGIVDGCVIRSTWVAAYIRCNRSFTFQ
jgi:hypothetical protein